MLYRTLFSAHSTIFPTLSPHLLSSSSPSSVSNHLQEMECVQGALLSGFESATAPKTASLLEEFSASNGASCDDLFVDQLLDFSNDFNEEEEEEPQKPDETVLEEKEKNCSVSLENPTAPEKTVISVKEDFVPLPEIEISVPVEGLESLEWLSHFVEESFSDYSLTGKLTSMAAANRTEPDTSAKEKVCFTTPVQTKARTKRARTGVRVWPVLSHSFTESSTSSSSSTSSATSFPSAPPNPWPVQGQTGYFSNVKPLAKNKKKPADAGAAGGGGSQPRRCSHCGVTKTPQWRAGPLGSKTLCNACGVRFKSGRLLPEYRPACSPTFSSQLHSNNHRKVLEMRRKKEPETEPDAGLPPPVQSF